MMESDSKIFIANHNSMFGTSLQNVLLKNNYKNIITKSEDELDLTNENEVKKFFSDEKPEYVFLSAGKSGGIAANQKYPAEFIYNNLKIQNNIIHYAWVYGVKKLMFLGSSCCYPKESAQPIKEEYLMTGVMEGTSEAYSTAKVAGIKMCEAYNRQYNTFFIPVIPTNLYGPNDDFSPENSHVLSAIMRKIYEAKLNNLDNIVLWGTGKPKREFLYIDDLAEACIFLMNSCEAPELTNIGYGTDVEIKELALVLKKVIGYNGDIVFDTTKPDGTLRKLLDSGKINQMGWKAKVKFEDGIKETLKWFIENYYANK